jgi:ketosteroid isomerase-like protein
VRRIALAAVESDSQYNIEIVRQLFEAFTNRDFEAMESLIGPQMEFWAPTAEFARGGRPYIGREGIREYFEDVGRVWRTLEVVPHEFRDLGDRVLVLGRVYARGEGGYISDSPAGWLFRLSGDQIVYGRVFARRADALAAAGLEE